MHRYLTSWYHEKAKKMSLGEITKLIKVPSLPRKLQDLLRQTMAILSSKEGAKKKIIILAALLYVAVTMDACPDFLPLIGYMDDISVLGAVIQQIK